jgi:hypothetical protein
MTAGTLTVGPEKGAPTGPGCAAGRRVLHLTLVRG